MKFFYLTICITYSLGYKLPEGINLCHRSKPDFNECVAKNIRGGLEAFAKGNREMGVPVLEPYFIKKMEVKPKNSGGTVSLRQAFSDVNIYNMTVADIVHFESNFDKECTWIMDAVTPVLNFQGNYEMDGKVVVFPIKSHGKCNISIVALRNRHSMWCEKYKKNGKDFIRITNYTMDMHPEKIVFDFTDLFPSNKDIEKEILKTVNENTLSIFNEIKDGFEQIFSIIFLKTSNIVLSKVPFDEMFLP